MTPPKKHILFISSWYPNRQNPTHGIFNKEFALAASIQNKVTVLHVCSDESLKNGLEFVETEENGITTLIVYYKKVVSNFPFFSQLKKRERLLNAFELGYQKLVAKVGTPDLIQLNVVMPAGLGAYHLSEKYNIPYVINEGWTGYTPEDGNYKGFFQKYFTRKIVAKAKAIMPVSEHLKKAMLSHNLEGNYFIVPNVVDVSVFKPAEKQNSTKTRFIHISALEDIQKNVSGILRAVEKVRKAKQDVELVIVGDGEDKSTLQNLAKELNIDKNVHFKGRLKREELVAELNASDALLMFSNYETFCLGVVEALSCGKPVITSRAGGVTSEITAELGIMIDPKDEVALTKAMLDLVNSDHTYDPKIIRRFVIDNFTKEIIAQKLNEVYTFALQAAKNK